MPYLRHAVALSTLALASVSACWALPVHRGASSHFSAARVSPRGTADLPCEPARSADDFVDSIGVCTHWSFRDTIYGSGWDQAKALIGALGIRNIRDGYDPREADLYRMYGIQTTVIFSPTQTPPAEQLTILHQNPDIYSMIEGPNEVNLFHQFAQYQGQGFPIGPKRYQHDLYAAVKADPLLSSKPVISFSIGNIAGYSVAPETDFDYEVMHSYAGGNMPSVSLGSHDSSAEMNADFMVGPGNLLKPIVATESGYHTALGSSVVLGGAQPGVSERAQAKYLPRMFAEYFADGIRRTFSYDFLDDFNDYNNNELEATNAEACFGLIKHNLQPKPAYYAERNLIFLLKEARWDVRAQRWVVPAFHPGTLHFSLSGDTRNVHHVLLEKSDGSFWLVLWQEVPSFNLATKRDIDNAPVSVDLKVGEEVRKAEIYTPGVSLHPTGVFQNARIIPVSVPDELTIVHVVLRRPKPNRAAASPSEVMGRATATRCRICWSRAPGAVGYFVYRVGKPLGETSNNEFVDTAVQPGTGYTYSVRAYDASGCISPAVSTPVYTQQAFPDLIVTSLSWEPVHPTAGSLVTFKATVKNIGNLATPQGVVIGVAFDIDGKLETWSDTMRTALSPGESRPTSASGGPNGPLWTAAPGSHEVIAHVDDINRIVESNKSNNTLTEILAVAPATPAN